MDKPHDADEQAFWDAALISTTAAIVTAEWECSWDEIAAHAAKAADALLSKRREQANASP